MVKTGGEGGKGQTVRSGGGKGPAFEGGQTAWARRLPHRRGYSQKARDIGHFRTRLRRRSTCTGSRSGIRHVEVTPESLRRAGSLKALLDGVKILGGAAQARRSRRDCASATCSSRRPRAKRSTRPAHVRE